jgi:hypothetical protein
MPDTQKPVLGAQTLAPVARSLVPGAWSLVLGAWSLARAASAGVPVAPVRVSGEWVRMFAVLARPPVLGVRAILSMYCPLGGEPPRLVRRDAAHPPPPRAIPSPPATEHCESAPASSRDEPPDHADAPRRTQPGPAASPHAGVPAQPAQPRNAHPNRTPETTRPNRNPVRPRKSRAVARAASPRVGATPQSSSLHTTTSSPTTRCEQHRTRRMSYVDRPASGKLVSVADDRQAAAQAA